jgi:hypothetical protein
MWRNLIQAAALLVLSAGAVFADDEVDRSPAAQLTIRCLQLVRAESSFPPTSSRQVLEAHQLRMRTICWDWRALAANSSAERSAKGQALLERCLKESEFDLARAHEVYYTRHVDGLKQMCRDFSRLVFGR